MNKKMHLALLGQRHNKRRGVGPLLIALVAVLASGAVFAGNAWAQSEPALPLTYIIDPPTIAISNGDGRPKQAQLNLTISPPQAEEVALDIVFAVDRSATTDIEFVQEVGEFLLGALPMDGRIALVSFAETATVDVGLTDSPTLFRGGLNDLRNIGKTAIGDGIFEAAQLLESEGRPDAVWMMVLLTDGRANAGRNPRLQAERADNLGIQIITVGMGTNPDETLLADIAEATGGSFFRDFSFSVLDEINAFGNVNAALRDVDIVQTLAPGIVFEESVSYPPTRLSGDANVGTRLEWQFDELPAGESLTISFKVSATHVGVLNVNQAPSEITYNNFRDRRTVAQLPPLFLEVLPRNESPVAVFTFAPDAPTTTVDVEFNNQSYDPDGTVAEFFWDFGDGNTSVLRDPKHRYERDGTYDVTLTVVDNLRDSHSYTQVVVVETKDITVNRTIETFLSTDITLPGEMFRVRLEIEINKSLNGMGVTEAINQGLPDDWIIDSVNHDAAKFKRINSAELQWVFLEVLNPGDKRTIVYEVTLPETSSPGTFTFNGVASSVSPNIEIRTSGDAQVEVKPSLPIVTIVSRWDPPSAEGDAGRLNLMLSDMITFDQVQVAVAWWLAGAEVPNSGGLRIDFTTIQVIIAHWLTNTPITEPLPGAEGES